ncbi:MAG: hypothetical protein ACFFD4_26070 [Candidatus Odinarchaeota archaeon]
MVKIDYRSAGAEIGTAMVIIFGGILAAVLAFILSAFFSAYSRELNNALKLIFFVFGCVGCCVIVLKYLRRRSESNMQDARQDN